MKTRLLAGAVGGIALVVAAACGGPGATLAPGATAAPPAATRPSGVGSECVKEAADSGTLVELTTNAFPEETRIAVGETITWTNNDIRTHTVTFRGGPNCSHLLIGGSASITFNTPGTFDYLCQFHDPMTSRVIVE